MKVSAIFAIAMLALPAFVPMGPVLAAQSDEAIAVSSGVEYEYIQTYSVARLNTILTSELDDFMSASTLSTAFRGKFPPAMHAVKLYRVKYRSVVPELDNRPTVASGLVAIPDTGVTTMPVVSYQHGTVFDKSYVPSNPEASMETRIMIARFASQGYVIIGADYFGRGVSDLPDSYLVKDSTRQANYDMLLAARDVLTSMKIEPDQLFVSGWSQGGWATMVYLQKLEEVGEKVTAAAAASAPVDVYIAMNRWLNNYQPTDAVYLPGVVALQLQAQEYYHQQAGLTESAILPEYLQAARELYRNRMDFDTFFTKTQSKLQDFIKPAFRASAYLGQTPYWRVLDRDQAYRWTSVTPLRTYYGGRDEVTPVYIGKLPAATQAVLGGAPAEAIDAGATADHRAVFIYGVIDQKDWFDTFLIKK
jgi:pimeloyl-ACP methyl ester carboxylesterase